MMEFKMSYLSEMFYSLYRKLTGISPENREYTHFLVCYLKCEDKVLLENTEVRGKRALLPIVVPVSPVCDLKSEFEKVQRVLGSMFGISSEQIELGYRPYTLFPLEEATYYVVTITIDGHQSYMLESNHDYRLEIVPENYLSLNSDSNYFYQIYCIEKNIF